MKKVISKQLCVENDDMRPEYDFASMKRGVRGKYYKAYRAGHTVKIHKADGTTVVHYFKPEDGAVMLEADVREYFPDSEAVNNALRCLIPLMQRKRKAKVKTKIDS
jgi:hypothetical protein